MKKNIVRNFLRNIGLKDEKKQENELEERLLEDLIKEQYSKKGLTKILQKDLQILENNSLIYLRDWKALSEEEKDKDGYPRGLRMILDKEAGLKVIFFYKV